MECATQKTGASNSSASRRSSLLQFGRLRWTAPTARTHRAALPRASAVHGLSVSRGASRPRPLQEPSPTHHARAPACSGAPLVPSPSFSTSSPPHVVGTGLGQAYENLKWSGVCRVPALSCSWPTGPMYLLPPVPVSPSAYVLESSEGLPSRLLWFQRSVPRMLSVMY